METIVCLFDNSIHGRYTGTGVDINTFRMLPLVSYCCCSECSPYSAVSSYYKESPYLRTFLPLVFLPGRRYTYYHLPRHQPDHSKFNRSATVLFSPACLCGMRAWNESLEREPECKARKYMQAQVTSLHSCRDVHKLPCTL